jgi:hypothetical protein
MTRLFIGVLMVGPSFLAACGGDGGDGNADAAVDVDASVVADAGVAIAQE